jgi:hypothetical protein
MPLDDSPLTLVPESPGAAADDERSSLQVLVSIIELPTQSVRDARRMVALQLDRLSPIPAKAAVFDVALLPQEGGRRRVALAIARAIDLDRPEFKTLRRIAVRRLVENQRVSFSFKNPYADPLGDVRLLHRAPQACLVLLPIALISLAGAYRIDQWATSTRAARADQEQAALQKAISLRQQSLARAAWRSLERTDGSTKILCVLTRIGNGAPSALPIVNLIAEPTRVVVATTAPEGTTRLRSAGATIEAQGDRLTGAFGQEVCG